ncbi:MAG: glycosyltransferase family 2 protein [Prevotella sp.]|nr:glycosyltransferase family 2 protein [Prevotella sp.]
MNNYKISIIIPVYNVEPYVEACLQSVANQTMTDGVECIIVDDCGNDNSMKVVEQFIKNYDGSIHFHVINHENNKGLSAARNTAIKAAQGEYIYFLDSDDTITEKCMETMYSYVLRYGKVDLVQGFLCERNNTLLSKTSYKMPLHTTEQRIIKKFLLTYAGDIIPAQARLIKLDFLLNHNLFFREGIIHEDNYWCFFLAKYTTSMCFCNERNYYHRYNPSSITGNLNRKKEAIAFRTIVKELCANIDPFLPGIQKEYILNNLLTALNGEFYHSEKGKNELVEYVSKTYSFIERLLFHLYLKTNHSYVKTKILHLLIRTFKL